MISNRRCWVLVSALLHELVKCVGRIMYLVRILIYVCRRLQIWIWKWQVHCVKKHALIKVLVLDKFATEQMIVDRDVMLWSLFITLCRLIESSYYIWGQFIFQQTVIWSVKWCVETLYMYVQYRPKSIYL